MRRSFFALAFVVMSMSAASAIGVEPAKLQKRCPDLTYNQAVTELEKLVQDYRFSDNPDEALEQAGMLLCPTAEQRSMLEKHYATPSPANYVPPPPRYVHPQHVRPHPAPPPQVVYPQRSRPSVRVQPVYVPAPGVVYGPRVTNSHSHYGRNGVVVRDTRSLPFQRKRGEPFCLAEKNPEAFKRKFPAPTHARDGRRYTSCEITAIPGKPCPGWYCSGEE